MNETPSDLGKAVDQLRLLLVGLAGIVLVVSLSFSGFVWKITRNTAAVTEARRQQLTQMQNNRERLVAIANELGNCSVGRPELLAIFRAHGIDWKPTPATKAPAR